MTITEAVEHFFSLSQTVSSDTEEEAIRAINLACEELELKRFKHGLVSFTYTYEAGSASVAFSSIVESSTLASIETLSTSSGVIRLVDFGSYNNMLRKQELRFDDSSFPAEDLTNTAKSGYYAYCVGPSLTLKPTPTEDTSLTLVGRLKLDYFSIYNTAYATDNDAPTNYLLTYFPSLVLARALMFYAIYTHDTYNYELYKKDYELQLEEALSWDASLYLDKLEQN